MRTVTSAFATADLRPLLDAIDEDVVWRSASHEEGLFCFGGVYRQRVGVMELTSKIASRYSFQRLNPIEVTSTGDVVWGRFKAELDYLMEGPGLVKCPLELEMTFRWLMRNGKIVEHQGYFDTARILIQQSEFMRRQRKDDPPPYLH
jgi:ketosteroid isomerase-like protein